MKTSSVSVRVAFLCSVSAWTALVAADAPPPEVKESPQEKQAKVYRALFEKVGLSGLPDLTKDKDTGLALQASWELHKKLVKRPEIPGKRKPAGAPNDTYDPNELKKFLTFLNDRTKAPLPDWWAVGISDLYVRKGEHHLYFGADYKYKKIELDDINWRVGEGVELTLRDGRYSYKSTGVSLEYQKDLFSGCVDALAEVSGEKIACLAAYSVSSGNCFSVAGFESKGGKRIWKVDIWAVARQRLYGGGADHRVEMTVKGDTVFVFGAELGGMYLEAFDLGTGKCQFRFCTNYWGNWSEGWNLKPGD